MAHLMTQGRRRDRRYISLAIGVACLVAAASGAAPPAIAQTGVPAAASIKAGAADPQFQQPYIDKDEWRDAPVRHRYVHGGFKGTDTRFSFYFPDKAQYQGRFFQHITPVPVSENLAQETGAGEESKIGFALASGGYFVETNGGGGNNIGGPDPTITAYRANAAAADYSRVVARKMFGGKRPYGYAYGGSGGGYRTVGSIENTDGVWDGVVPYVLGSPMAMPNVFTVRIHAMRILWHKFPQILDAIEPGGSGDPYAGLNEEESAALREVTAMGFPMRSWFGYKTMGVHGFAAIYPIIKMMDGAYFKDFWNQPGYLGAKPTASLLAARIQHPTTVSALATAKDAKAAGVVLQGPDGGVDKAFLTLNSENENTTIGFHLASPLVAKDYLGGDLVIRSGAAAGKFVQISKVVGDMVILGPNDPSLVAMIKPGDEVTLDTSDFLAAQTYHRHQVPARGYPVYDVLRKSAGTPLYPQRPMLIGPLITRSTVGSDMTGNVHGKVIVVDSLWDREAFPWQADWYAQQVKASTGARFDDTFRLWYTDHALHGDETRQDDPTRTVSYIGMLQQALRDVSAWAEKGIAPPASTNYRIAGGQVELPTAAADRHGIQPVPSLLVEGGKRAEVKAGQAVRFVAIVSVPKGGGKLVEARWDLDGSGAFATSGKLRPAKSGETRVDLTFTFAKPGTYFPSVRVAAQRDGDAKTPYARLYNLDSVRVVVK